MSFAGDPRFKHRHQIRVRFRDTDSQGVVNYANYYFFFAEAIFEYYRDLGIPLRQLNAEGLDLTCVHSEADYRDNAGLEELLTVYSRVAWVGRSSLGNEHIVVGEDGRLLVKGAVTQVVIDRQSKQPVPVPEYLRAALREAEGADLAETVRA